MHAKTDQADGTDPKQWLWDSSHYLAF